MALLLYFSNRQVYRCTRGGDGAPTEEAFVAEDDPILTAIVVVKAASGASYMDDRESIATMPELKTIEEMRDFIARYEPAPEDTQAVRSYLEKQGCNTIAQDNLFLIVSGTHTCFDRILNTSNNLPALSVTAEDTSNRLMVFQIGDFQTNATLAYVDGMFVISSDTVSDDSLTSTSQPVRYTSTNTACSPPSCYTIDDVAQLLHIPYVHQSSEGATGDGVRIGFLDTGVSQGHSFFTGLPRLFSPFNKPHPLDAEYYTLNDMGVFTKVTNNYSWSLDNDAHHGTMIAAFLTAFAPDAKLKSLRPKRTQRTKVWIMAALTYESNINW